MLLNYNINLNKPQQDPDVTSNMDMMMDIQNGLQTDIGNALQAGQQPQPQQQIQPATQPVDNSQRGVMPPK